MAPVVCVSEMRCVWGRAGWPQDDAQAEKIFDMGTSWLPKVEKVQNLVKIGQSFAAQPDLNLPENRVLRLKYLAQAAQESPDDYGTFCLRASTCRRQEERAARDRNSANR